MKWQTWPIREDIRRKTFTFGFLDWKLPPLPPPSVAFFPKIHPFWWRKASLREIRNHRSDLLDLLNLLDLLDRIPGIPGSNENYMFCANICKYGIFWMNKIELHAIFRGLLPPWPLLMVKLWSWCKWLSEVAGASHIAFSRWKVTLSWTASLPSTSATDQNNNKSDSDVVPWC